MWKTHPQNFVFLHLLVYRGDILRPVLAKKAFKLNFSFPPLKILFSVINYKPLYTCL